jgi:hypothetical protein
MFAVFSAKSLMQATPQRLRASETWTDSILLFTRIPVSSWIQSVTVGHFNSGFVALKNLGLKAMNSYFHLTFESFY